MKRSIVTVHDLILVQSDGPKGFLARLAMKATVAAAHSILCPSQDVCKQIHPIAADRGEIVKYLRGGVMANAWVPLTDSQREHVRDSLGLSRYLLVVGIDQPRKGHHWLPRIVDLMRHKDVQIVVAGEAAHRAADGEVSWKNWLDSKHPDLRSRFIFFGEVNESTLWKLYSAAEVFLFPSSAEGFGLPVLEALASGTCVVASSLDVLREIGGEAVTFCPQIKADGSGAEEWATAIDALLDDVDKTEKSRNNGPAYAREQWDWLPATIELTKIFSNVSSESK